MHGFLATRAPPLRVSGSKPRASKNLNPRVPTCYLLGKMSLRGYGGRKDIGDMALEDGSNRDP
eukprot:6173612-Pleurochrysis_carterae.AAC.1